MGRYQIKSFCAADDTIKKVKDQPIEWEKVFVNHIPDMELVLEYIKTFYPTIIKR